MFDIHVYHHFPNPADTCKTESLIRESFAKLEKQIEENQKETLNRIKNMADQQAELDAAVQEAVDAITAELAEIKAILDSSPAGKPLDLSKVKQLKAIVSGMSDKLQPASPVEGKHNVRVSYRTVGEESQWLNFGNDGAGEEQEGRLNDMHREGLNAAKSEPLKGPKVPTTLTYSDNGEAEHESLTHLIQIAAYQSAIAGAVKAVADEQLAELRALPEE